jgi:hypothetical protein
LFSILGDRTSETNSSDRASFPAGLLGQRLGYFVSQTIVEVAVLLKLDYFSSNPCDRPAQWKKSRAIAFSLVWWRSPVKTLQKWRSAPLSNLRDKAIFLSLNVLN